MQKTYSWLLILFLFLIFPWNNQDIFAQQNSNYSLDQTAEKILLYQRRNGGWAQYNGDPTDYRLPIDEKFKQKLISDKEKRDATIDDGSTTFEIDFLLQAYQKTKNLTYLKSAEKGIEYLLSAQNSAGGWPQKFPDLNGYHKHITFNDEAMISVLWIVKGLAENHSLYEDVDKNIKLRASISLERGIDCILKTQYVQQGKLTAWCAQHDSETLLPAAARAFEPMSLSGKESVGIIKFLESLENPGLAVENSIKAGKEWLASVALPDVDVLRIEASDGPDNVVVDKPGHFLWARFYDLETNKPIFMGRDRVPHAKLNEIERERRAGYAYLGDWPKSILP